MLYKLIFRVFISSFIIFIVNCNGKSIVGIQYLFDDYGLNILVNKDSVLGFYFNYDSLNKRGCSFYFKGISISKNSYSILLNYDSCINDKYYYEPISNSKRAILTLAEDNLVSFNLPIELKSCFMRIPKKNFNSLFYEVNFDCKKILSENNKILIDTFNKPNPASSLPFYISKSVGGKKINIVQRFSYNLLKDENQFVIDTLHPPQSLPLTLQANCNKSERIFVNTSPPSKLQ